MTRAEQRFTRILASPLAALTVALIAAAMAYCSLVMGETFSLTANRGLALPSPNLWMAADPVAALCVNVATILATTVLAVWINIRFNITRSHSATFLAVFMIMCAASPSLVVTFAGSSLLALVMVAAMALLMNLYGDWRATPRMFLAFALLSAGILCQYGFAPYLPVLLLGLAQMRVMRFRSLVAAMLGLITPFWIWWWCSPEYSLEFNMPQTTNIFDSIGSQFSTPLIATGCVSVFFSLVFGALNIVKTMGYNARSRANYGLLNLMWLVTVAMMAVDYGNMPFYLVFINLLTAWQVGHFFSYYSNRRGYVSILLLIATYVGLWLWDMLA